jgi:FkbM family methyltransferase
VNRFINFFRQLPLPWRHELRRLRYRHQIKGNNFTTAEPEFDILDQLVSPGDWVLDVGANVGHYTKRLSDLVGSSGRVIAVEPIPETFALLASNAAYFASSNVTLLNVALSAQVAEVGMCIPKGASSTLNYYRAQISSANSDVSVLALRLDALEIQKPVRLIKIDAEGHDRLVLEGAENLIRRDSPTIIIETDSDNEEEINSLLSEFGYESKKLANSPNTIFSCDRDRLASLTGG